jgi:two-component system, NtrC family, response regulator HydG
MRDKKKSARILLVDDDFALLETIEEGLVDAGFEVVAMTKSKEAVEAVARPDIDALVTDLRMPGIDGLGLLAHSRRAAPDRPVIVMTAFSAVDSAIESIRNGAYHYLTKPFKVDELTLFLGRALEEAMLRREAKTLRRAFRKESSLENVVGRSGGMREVCSLVSRIADADVPVLVLGETGTGKGLVARALHNEGRRSAGPFVTLNCAALPEQLLESELFGHVKGAFTGATASRRGMLEEADGGTLFLDEIGEMAVGLQAKLLGVLESGVVRAVGANKETPIDVRFVAATHRDLRERVTKGLFREDLLFRLDVVSVEIPPLRQRRTDLPELLAHFLDVARSKHPLSPVRRLSSEAMQRLLDHAWPGNVRELEHVVERLVLLGTQSEAGPSDLPKAVHAAGQSATEFVGPVEPLAEVERRYAAWALEQLDGRRMLTAEKLDIDRKTLGRLLGDKT